MGRAGGGRITAVAARRATVALLIFVATLVAYVPALRGGWVWDDDFHVTANRNLSDLRGLARIWLTTRATPQYYPLTHTSFWIEHHLWDLHPLGYHAVNVVLHATSAILLGMVLVTLGVPGAWLAAAIFALHPVQVESVAWVTERKNVLSGMFYLASALVFLRHALGTAEAGAGPGRGGRAGRPWPLALSLGLFVCGLLSKTVVATLPVALILVLAWKTGRVERRTWPWLAAMIVLGAALGLSTAWLEQHNVGAEGPEFSLGLVERGLVAGRAVWFYLGELAWPHPLAFVYARWNVDSSEPWQFLFPAAALAAAVALWLLRSRLGTAPLVAYAYFVATLGPALGFLNVFPMRYSFVADHFQYLACIGPIALFAAACARGARPWGTPVRGALASAPLLAVLALLTWQQGHAYRDAETLWRRTLEVSPDAFMAHYNLGRLLAARGRDDEAIAHYREAIRIKPDLPEALNNLANALANRGQAPEAIDLYRRALRADPRMAEAHNNLGLTLEEVGRLDEAEAAYRSAIRVRPELGAAHLNLAVLLFRRERYAEARDEVRLARLGGVEPNPGFVRALSEKLPEPSR